MLKANHSWGTFRKIKFPIEQSERAELEELGRSWLARKNYNLKGGEWWYSTITPKLYIEELVSDDDNSPREFHFRCVKGEVVGISMTQRDGVGKDNFETAYHADFSWNSEIKFFKSLPNNYNETPKNSKNMIEYASAIAQQFEYARVDFYSPQPDVVLLGELTLCSGAGLSYILPNSEDLSMGASWDMSQYFI